MTVTFTLVISIMMMKKTTNKSNLVPHDKSLRKHLPFGAWVTSTEVLDYSFSRHRNPRIHGLVRVHYIDIVTNEKSTCLVKSFLKEVLCQES